MLLAKILALPRVANWIINLAMRTPDEHLPGYMERFWLFNPYNRETRRARYPFIPFSIRVHHILRADLAHDKHDHPWNARTFILRNWYVERRGNVDFLRRPGDTATLNFGEFHNITRMPSGGVWTLFVMGKFQGEWGFDVDGRKVDHKTYLNSDKFRVRRGDK